MKRETTECLISCEFKSKSTRKVLGLSLGEKEDSDAPQEQERNAQCEMAVGL